MPRRAKRSCLGRRASEVARDALALPVAVTRRLGPVAAAQFLRHGGGTPVDRRAPRLRLGERALRGLRQIVCRPVPVVAHPALPPCGTSAPDIPARRAPAMPPGAATGREDDRRGCARPGPPPADRRAG